MLGSAQKRNGYLLAIFAWFALSFCVLLSATTSRFSFVLISDKVTHAMVFCLMLLVLGWHAKNWKRLGWMLFALLTFGCGIEVVQAFVPQRTASLSDVVADVIGLACGASLLLLVRSSQVSRMIDLLVLQTRTKPTGTGAPLASVRINAKRTSIK